MDDHVLGVRVVAGEVKGRRVAGEFRIEVVDETWPGFPALVDLVYEVLYRDFGVAEDADWHRPSSVDGAVFAASLGSEVVGTVRLIDSGERDRLQVRQLAVRRDVQRGGIGRALAGALEAEARARGAREVWLNARADAYAFYERLGYRYTGPTFVSELTRLEHRPMLKTL